jgi:hypothetical protein
MVVAFIQNTNSKNVYQAASSEAWFTSAQSDVQDFKVLVYPNPTSQILNLSYPSSESVQIQLFNSQGQIIHTETSSGISDAYSTDVSAFVPGIYLCKIIAGDKEHVSRVLIQAQ